MNEIQDAHDILAGMPGWRNRAASLVPLGGGLNNRSYRVDADGSQYVLRLGRRSAIAGGGNPRLETIIQQRAATRGLAAPPIYADAKRGTLLSEFVEGSAVTPGELGSGELLAEIAALLRKLHALPLCGVTFNPGSAAKSYLGAIDSAHPDIEFAHHCGSIVADTPQPKRLCCCHNDVVASNLVRGVTLKLIDFEYACDNDPLFDLASLLCWHNLGEEQRDALLAAYAGRHATRMATQLATQCRLFDALQWLWLASQPDTLSDDPSLDQMHIVKKRLS